MKKFIYHMKDLVRQGVITRYEKNEFANIASGDTYIEGIVDDLWVINAGYCRYIMNDHELCGAADIHRSKVKKRRGHVYLAATMYVFFNNYSDVRSEEMYNEFVNKIKSVQMANIDKQREKALVTLLQEVNCCTEKCS